MVKCKCGGKIIWNDLAPETLEIDDEGLVGSVIVQGNCEVCRDCVEAFLTGDITAIPEGDEIDEQN